MPVIKISNESFHDVPIFPLDGVHLFPQTVLPLHIFEPRYIEMLEYVLDHDHLIAIADTTPTGDSVSYNPKTPAIRPILGAGVVVASQEQQNGQWHILVQGVTRLSLIEELPQTHAFRQVHAQILQDTEVEEEPLFNIEERVRNLLAQFSPKSSSLNEVIGAIMENASTPEILSNMLSAHLIRDPTLKRILFEELNPKERLDMIYQNMGELILHLLSESEEMVIH